MSTPFSAAPPAIGYLYQLIPYALYVVLKQTGKQETYIRLEKLDDIELCEGSTPLECFQVKHTTGPLTDRSSDLWRTIRVWSENYSQGILKLPETILTFATTANAPEGSIASLLRPGAERQVELALKQMLCETEKATDTLASMFAAFKSLNSNQQRSLVEAIQVLDNAPNVDEIGEYITKMFVGVHDECRTLVYSDLLGWWYIKVVQHLRNGSVEPISRASICTKIAELSDKYKRKLHDPFIDELLPANYDYDNRTFVLQLKLIELPAEMINIAKRDFYCIGKSRSWLIDELHLDKLTTYDQRLKEEWILCVNEVIDEHDPTQCDETEQRKIGRKIYRSVQRQVNIPIHDELLDLRYTRGSYHILADAAGIPDVGWHPHFKVMLSKVLGAE